jgi:hypothetical protein
MSSQTVAPPGTLAELQSYTPEQIQSVGAYQYLTSFRWSRIQEGSRQ